MSVFPLFGVPWAAVIELALVTSLRWSEALGNDGVAGSARCHCTAMQQLTGKEVHPARTNPMGLRPPPPWGCPIKKRKSVKTQNHGFGHFASFIKSFRPWDPFIYNIRKWVFPGRLCHFLISGGYFTVQGLISYVKFLEYKTRFKYKNLGHGAYGPRPIWAPGPWAPGPSLLGKHLTRKRT